MSNAVVTSVPVETLSTVDPQVRETTTSAEVLSVLSLPSNVVITSASAEVLSSPGCNSILSTVSVEVLLQEGVAATSALLSFIGLELLSTNKDTTKRSKVFVSQ